jgi:four helix bundle protein
LAEGHEICDGDIQRNRRFSFRGKIRTHLSIAARSSLHSEQYRRGQARFSQKEFHHFLSIARGSMAEIETQLSLAKDLQYLTVSNAAVLLASADELGRTLNGLIASI